jgi:hypothetical protein
MLSWWMPSLIEPSLTPASSASVVVGAVETLLLSYHSATA